MQTITKVFDTYNQAERAVTALESAGVHSSEISIVANNNNAERHANNAERHANDDNASQAGTGAGIGAAVGGAAGLLTGLGLMAIPGVGPVVAAGWLVSTAVGAVAGGATGGIVGSLVSSGLDDEHAHVYTEAVRRGGTLLSVRAQDSQVDQVHGILDEHRPLDPAELGAEYRKTGWQTFESTEESMAAKQAEIDRARHII
jgi:uncharacterized membrane protein